MKKPATKTIIGLMFAVAAFHLLRIVLHLDIEVQNTLIPRWLSLVTFTISVSLGVLLAHESE